MQIETLTARLKQNGEAIVALTTAVSDAQARWKPTPQEWSILETINHLFDEEHKDFRPRLSLLLHEPEAEWLPIDPEGWVTEQQYNSRDLAKSQDSFRHERETSLAFLLSLQNPKWDNSKQLRWGPMTARQMAHNWLAHDQLHIRQLAQLHHQWAEAQAAPESLLYAGGW